MIPHYESQSVTLWHGDCLDVLTRDELGYDYRLGYAPPAIPDNSIDSVTTDPPYGLGFMGKEWDDLPPGLPFAQECLRVLKPGGHLLAFGGTRTWHRLAVAVEDAGFEMRDSIAWLYGSGFPKSLDVSKAIDKQRHDRDDIRRVTAWVAAARTAAGVTNRDIDAAFGFNGMAGHWTTQGAQAAIPTLDQVPALLAALSLTANDVPDEIRALLIDLNGMKGQPGEAWSTAAVLAVDTRYNEASGIVNVGQGDRELVNRQIKAANSDDARAWEGWGTALKPAFEPVVVARKPLAGTVAANVLTHGTGALNIDGCRIPHGADVDLAKEQRQSADTAGMKGLGDSGFSATHTQPLYAEGGRWPANVVLDESQAAELDEQSGITTSPKTTGRGASSKASSMSGTLSAQGTVSAPGDSGGASRFFYIAKADQGERVRIDGIAHPTVKPIALMRWLARLVTPSGGTVLEPFAGSGTTVEACVLEGFRCVAIEREAEYLPLIVQRIHRRRDPVAAVKGAGEDGGLFDLLDGGAA